MTECEKRDKLEKALVFLTKKFEKADNLTKPVLFHSMRVGFYLYNNNYEIDIVLDFILQFCNLGTLLFKGFRCCI